MKKSIIHILCLLAVSAFFAPTAFAGAPVPGINIIVKTHPGGIMVNTLKTDKEGKATAFLKEGTYDIVLKYADVVKMVSSLDKGYAANPDKYDITLLIDGKGIKVNADSCPAKRKVTLDSCSYKITVPKGGANLNLIATFGIEKPGVK